MSSKIEKLESLNKELKLQQEEQTKEVDEKEKNLQNMISQLKKVECLNRELEEQLKENGIPKKGEEQKQPVTDEFSAVNSENDPRISGPSGQEVSRKRKISHESKEYVEEPDCKKEVFEQIIDKLAEQLIDQKKLLVTLKAEKSKVIARIDRGTQNLSNIRDRIKAYCQNDQE